MTLRTRLGAVFLYVCAIWVSACISPAVTVSSVVPSSGPIYGGTLVTISGTGFVDVQSVSIGGQELTELSVAGPTSITGIAPAGTAGIQDVVVTTRSGSVVFPRGFTYIEPPPPTLIAIAPGSGPVYGGTPVTIVGTGFIHVQSVTIGGHELAGLSVTSDTSITGTTIAGAEGVQDVVVVTDHGFGSLTNGFTYNPPFFPKQMGTAGNDMASGTATDGSGNIYIAGSTAGSFPGFTSAGSYDVFVTKLDRNGVQQWTRQVGTAADDRAYCVTTDRNGNVYVAGSTAGSFPGFSINGENDIFVLKLGGDGTQQWVQQLGTSSYDQATGIATDANGNVYMAGFTFGSFPSFTNAGLKDLFVARLNGAGAMAWVQQLGTDASDYAQSVSTDGSGNVYVTGLTGGSFPGFTSAGSDDFVAIKLNTNGVRQWIQQLGTSANDELQKSFTDAGGNTYLVGYTFGSFPGFSNAGGFDFLIVKLDSGGAQQWGQQFGTAFHDGAFGVAADNAGNVYVTGVTEGTFPGFMNAGADGSGDFLVIKLGAGGAQQWVRQFGTPGYDWGSGADVDSAGNVLAVGLTSGSLPGFANAGAQDVLLVKYDPNGIRL